MTTVITKPDSHGRKIRDAEKVLRMHRERDLGIAEATLTLATAGGWRGNEPRIFEIVKIASKLNKIR